MTILKLLFKVIIVDPIDIGNAGIHKELDALGQNFCHRNSGSKIKISIAIVELSRPHSTGILPFTVVITRPAFYHRIGAVGDDDLLGLIGRSRSRSVSIEITHIQIILGKPLRYLYFASRLHARHDVKT